MTWCGYQGFQAPPNNTFLVNGKKMGNWGYEVRLPPFRPFIIPSDRSQNSAIRIIVASHFSANINETPRFHHSPSSQLQRSPQPIPHSLIPTDPSFLPARPFLPPHPLRRTRRALRSTSSCLCIRQGFRRWECRVSIASYSYRYGAALYAKQGRICCMREGHGG